MQKKNLKRIISGLLCLVVVLTSVPVSAVNVSASTYNLGDTSIYKTLYLNQVYPDIKQIGEAYIVGTDEIPDFSKRIAVEKVPLGTKIQGGAIDEKYLDQNNMANLEALFSSVITAEKPNYDTSKAYLEGEEATLQVVAVNDDKVIFWSNGYRSFAAEGITAISCKADDFLLNHPPGFYQISASQVWLNIPTEEYNVIPSGKENAVAATGNTTWPTLGIWQKPSKEGRPAYVLGNNATVSLASTEKIATIDDSGSTYYKLIFKGSSTSTTYMASEKSYCYVDSLYVDVTMDGADKPSDLQTASIINLDSDKYLNLRSEKSEESGLVGRVVKNTNVKYSPSGSDSEWAMLWFSGQKCYIPAKHVYQGQYIAINNTGRLAIKDIVDGQYVVRWDPTNSDKGYTIAVTTTDDDNDLGKFGSYWLYKNKSYTQNEFTIDGSYFKDGDKNRSKIYFRVTSNSGMDTYSIELPRLSVLEETKAPTWNKAGGIVKRTVDDDSMYFNLSISSQIQIATDKNFTKNVQSEDSKTIATYFNYLKPKTTYYVRFRHSQQFTTAEGTEVAVYGPWSKVKKIKTKKTPKYPYVNEVWVKDIKNGQYVLTWNKPSGAKKYTVLVSENVTQKVLCRKKNYKKNTITIKKKWFKKGEKEVVVKVESKKKKPNGVAAYIVMKLPTQTASAENVKSSTKIYSEYTDTNMVAAKCKITITASGSTAEDGVQVQFSKENNFEDAKICQNSEGVSIAASGFDIGQTYYYRYRYIKAIETKTGEKYLYGNWSESLKITTPSKIKETVIEG